MDFRKTKKLTENIRMAYLFWRIWLHKHLYIDICKNLNIEQNLHWNYDETVFYFQRKKAIEPSHSPS